MTVFDAFLYVKKTIISQFFLGSRPLWLLSKLLQVQPPVSRADFASVEAYIKHLQLQIEYGRMKALIKSMENNDKGAIYLMLLSNTDNLLSVWDNLLSVAIVI